MKIIEKNDDNYGKIKYELVANINYLELMKLLGVQEYFKWSDKYHPSRYFSAILFEKKDCELANKLGVESENIDLYVCIDDINKDWDCSFWKSKYPETLKNKKYKLPVATTRKSVVKWLQVFNKLKEKRID